MCISKTTHVVKLDCMTSELLADGKARLIINVSGGRMARGGVMLKNAEDDN